jgi:toxin-antitoxin system PIN domain toxin
MKGMPQHVASRKWLEERFAGTGRVGLPWHSLLGFLRLTTNRRVFPRPMPTPEAWLHVEDWLAQPTAWIPQPTERHRAVLSELLVESVDGNLIPDAHLAALALEHGLTVCSADTDFARFPTVRWENPLTASR